jgi:hypothetical protein
VARRHLVAPEVSAEAIGARPRAAVDRAHNLISEEKEVADRIKEGAAFIASRRTFIS